MTNQEFADRLGWKVQSIAARMGALGLLVPCTRCAGSGHYSFCQQYGTTCFKCAGSGKQLPKLTARLATQAAELVAAGGLADYLAKLARIRAARERLPGIVSGCVALYHVIADDYTIASRTGDAAEFVKGRLFAFQGRNNRIRWGCTGGADPHPRYMSVADVENAAKQGAIDIEEAERILVQRRDELAALACEYRGVERT